MEKFYNVYMYYNCDERRHLPAEIEKMYHDQQNEKRKRKFLRRTKG